MHRAPFQRARGTVTAVAQSLVNDTYLHFNDPKLEPCVWPDLYPGGVGGYKVGCGIGCAAYYRSRHLAFDERWRRDRWWSFFQVSKEMKNQLSRCPFLAQNRPETPSKRPNEGKHLLHSTCGLTSL